jgi:hypothetical protein
MSEQLDPNKLVSEIVAKLVESAATKFLTDGKDVAKGAYRSLRILTTSHKKYVTRVAKEYYRSKSFLIQHTKTPLYDFYVPLGIQRGSIVCENANMQNLTKIELRGAVRHEYFNVITGNGGSGKSMLMRHLFLDALRSLDRVPVLIELRDLNSPNKPSLLDHIQTTLSHNDFSGDSEFFLKALEAGHFAFFLDGFDEVDDKETVGREIQNLASAYHENYVTVSSRTDDVFAGWARFNIWETLPLSLEKASDLVSKVPRHIFDSKEKKSFISELKTSLFESHYSFLSNPLLLSIMVLTYKDSADIPSKLRIFYDQAFTTLFYRHDALKGGYKRKRRCQNINIQDFAKVFSAFCLFSYGKRKVRMSEREALGFLNSAQKFVDFKFDAVDFLEDSIQAVSLLVRDGLAITFTHRSFQEYFTALRIRDIEKPEKQRAFIRKYLSRSTDAVVDLLFDIAPETVETAFLIPEFIDLEEIVGSEVPVPQPKFVKFLKVMVEEFVLQRRPMFRPRGINKLAYFPNLSVRGWEFYSVFQFVVEKYFQTRVPEILHLSEDCVLRFSAQLKEELIETDHVDVDAQEGSANGSDVVTHMAIATDYVLKKQNLVETFDLSYPQLGQKILKLVLTKKVELVEKYHGRNAAIDEELELLDD